MLPFAIIAMTLALTFYTIGVFGERKAGTIRGRDVAFFGLGFICDSTGTSVMKVIAKGAMAMDNFKTGLHTVTGALALLLMAIHLVWAFYVWKKGSTNAKATFHKFSIVVWAFWLIPYVLGMVLGMSH